MADFRRLLVPTDFTDTSARALDWAIDLATKLGASITVMHSYEIPMVSFPDGSIVATATMASQLGEAAQRGLARVVEERRSRGVALDSVLREGVAWEEINSVAESIDADVIVIGTHGRRGIARALLGSVAENVVRTSHRPVLTIHGPHE